MNHILSKVSDFVSEDSTPKNIVSILFNSIKFTSTYSEHYANWKKIFIFSHGELDTQRQINTKQIKEKYGVNIAEKEDLFIFAFVLEVYYSILLKLIAYRKINGEKRPDLLLTKIIDGSYFLNKGILNYFSPDYYNYITDITELNPLLIKLLEIIKNSPKIENDFDFIKIIYEELFPRELRHSMGEFYTPDWLAEFTVRELIKEDGAPFKKTYLDPTCGSGTFLYTVLRLFPKQQGNLIKQIFGVDINPLSVLAAKTNYILFLNESDLKNVVIPIFNTDIIKNPKYQNNDNTLFNPFKDEYLIKINELNISIPKTKYKVNDLSQLYKAVLTNDKSELEDNLAKIFSTIKKYKTSDKLAILDRFALLCLKDIDYIVGNPPWVNWEYLPKDYKKETVGIWQFYKLFDYKGLNSVFIKEDISSLITYVAIDNHLKEHGKIGFVLKESLFKSSKQGAGFRKFFIPTSNTHLYPYSVHDLTKFKPFNGVNNKTYLLFLSKGENWTYPIQFTEWFPNNKKSFNEFILMQDVIKNFEFRKKLASPINQNDKTAGWVTLDEENNSNLKRYLGKPDYKARTGVFTGGSNAIYWIRILNKPNNNQVEIENITERAKNIVPLYKSSIEKNFVYPLITGSDLSLWSFTYSRYIILPHTAESKMYPISENELDKYPLTKRYFKHFEQELINRKGFTSFDKNIHQKYFYTLQRIGDYTFKPYKVAWRYISKEFTPCVIESVKDRFLGLKNSIPNEKVIYIGLDNKDEAYYLCGVLSSPTIRKIINGFIVSIQIAPSTINQIKLPKFDDKNLLHQQISTLCQLGHKDNIKVNYLEKIDKIIKQIY